MHKIKFVSLSKKLLVLIISTVVAVSTIGIMGFGISSVSANATTATDVERSGLGLSVNAIKTDYLDLTELKDGAPVFESAWLKSQVDSANYISVNSTTTSSFKSSEFSSIAASYLTRFNFNTDVSLGVDLFMAGVSFGFEVENLIDYAFKVSQYYYMFNNKIERYTLSLPNYSTDLDSYKEHLSSNYLNALQQVFSGKMTYNEFFDTYGTHVILKGVYGGTMNMFYRLASNYYDVGGYLMTGITNAINASILAIVNLDKNASFDITATLDCESGDIVENTYFLAHGGSPFAGTSVSDFSSNFRSWANSVENSPVLISATSDGLVPLWKLLPAKYSGYQTAFENAFKKYASEYNDEILETYFHINFDDEDKYSFNSKRATEYLISDAGAANNPCDYIELNGKMFGCDIMRSAGFSKVDISVTLEMKEKNMGYQHFCLYTTDEKGKEKLIQSIQYEYGGTKLNTTYSYVTKKFSQIHLTDIIEFGTKSYKFKPIIIRYNASGAGADDWYNRNFNLEVTFTK